MQIRKWQLAALMAASGLLGAVAARMPVAALAGGETGKSATAKPATAYTKKANDDFAKTLPFADKRDFEEATKGWMVPLPNQGVLKGPSGGLVWDLKLYDFIKPDAKAPDTVNPSLWRQAQLLTFAGLFRLDDKIYQVRGQDLSNITFIEGDKGITLVDTLMTQEAAKAALELYYQHRPKRPIVAVIYTHSHADHFGGVKGLITEQDVAAGKIEVIAPDHFTNEAISENVMAGNAMSRRASYMYGAMLRPGPQTSMTSGLGLATSVGLITLLPPTKLITKTGEKMTIDGLTYEFQMVPGTEAPAEMHFYIHELKALCTAENACHNLHNLYTLRGAKTRNAKAWASYLNECLELFGAKAEVQFAPHHWPLWGNARIVEHITKMRDTFKYIHDQTLRLANHGYTMIEIAEMIELPPPLQANWASHGYYGSVNHNAKAVYNFYLGWFNGNPATLHELPPAAASRKYVEYMGGADAILAKARKDFAVGEYRWVAQVVNHVVLADPKNQEARDLQADTLEQLGYQAENGTWRNFYLTGAMELRNGIKRFPVTNANSPDMVASMSLDLFFDYLGVRLNGPKAVGKKLSVNMEFPDTKEKYLLTVDNSVLNYSKGKLGKDADCTVTLNRSTLNDIVLGKAKVAAKVAAGDIKIAGNGAALQEMLGLMDSFDFWFDIITANPPPASGKK